MSIYEEMVANLEKRKCKECAGTGTYNGNGIDYYFGPTVDCTACQGTGVQSTELEDVSASNR